MEQFDWAAFSYFTSYQDDFWVLVSRSPIWTPRLQAGWGHAVLDRHEAQWSSPIRAFRSCSYSDEGTEGMLACQLALARGEDAPLLLCTILPDSLDSHRRWDPEKEQLEESLWFEEALRRLETVERFPVTDACGTRTLFQLLRATDLEAYRALWAMTGHNCSIADATLSADCDRERLGRILSQGRFDVIRQGDQVGLWAYGQVYGGGAGEHHAVFRSRDATVTQQLWERVRDSAISRF